MLISSHPQVSVAVSKLILVCLRECLSGTACPFRSRVIRKQGGLFWLGAGVLADISLVIVAAILEQGKRPGVQLHSLPRDGSSLCQVSPWRGVVVTPADTLQ